MTGRRAHSTRHAGHKQALMVTLPQGPVSLVIRVPLSVIVHGRHLPPPPPMATPQLNLLQGTKRRPTTPLAHASGFLS